MNFYDGIVAIGFGNSRVYKGMSWEDIRPSKKILFVSVFLLAFILISESISEHVNNYRNNDVYEVVTSDDKKGMDEITNDMEGGVSEISERNREQLKSVYYKYLAIKWFLLTLLSYFSSCLLFHRLKEFE